MNKPYNLNAVLHDLKSEKVKERQQGLEALRSVFSRDEVIHSFDKKGTGEAWLTVFQALFTTIGHEKVAYTKKAASSRSASSGNTAARRLSDAAGMVRWLTERSVQKMNRTVVRCLLTHLLQMMVYSGDLLSPVALDYIKALKCVISWTPHVDHLTEDVWVKTVETAFNVVLGDSLKTSLGGNEEDDGYAEGSGALGAELDDSEFYLDDPDENSDESIASTGSRAKKRRRVEVAIPPANRPSSSKLKLGSTTSRSVTLEQIEFTSILTVLLRSSSAPLLSPNLPQLGTAILRRLQRFLDLYPADTSIYHDYLLALSATVSHLSLNKKYDVEFFARGAWDGLLRLWGTKNKAMKEDLLVVLHLLFPYFTVDQSSSPSWTEGIRKLWRLLDGEAESRWGVDGLSLESLRLQIESRHTADQEASPFVAHTFRAGWRFDTEQALAWAILELQADCAEKLFRLSESIHSTSRSLGKRPRLENPIASLLHSIQAQGPSSIRVYRLQILLFFIDKHWSVLYDNQQQDVIDSLLKIIGSEEAVTQSWAFLCLGSIAEAEKSPLRSADSVSNSVTRRIRDAATWDPIWTHAVRRACSLSAGRAACHVAHILLSNSKRFLTSQRVLIEIETLTKDLVIQGPSFPYDSVCLFFSRCLQVASQDVRLYRMQLEDKVLGWFLDSWKVGDSQGLGGSGGRSNMQAHMAEDILLLLESMCRLSKRCSFVSRILLPDTAIVKAMATQGQTNVIRDFLLYGKLPPFQEPRAESIDRQPSIETPEGSTVTGDLAPPRGRERRISAFLLKSLDFLISCLTSAKEADNHLTAEQAHQALDLAVIALLFESLLVLNGTSADRRVMQRASKLVTLLVGLLAESNWTMEDKASVLVGLEPLISDEKVTGQHVAWVAMSPPGPRSGIWTQILRKLLSSERQTACGQTTNRRLKRILFQSSDVQTAFGPTMMMLRDVLRAVADQIKDNLLPASTGMDDIDGFKPVRTPGPEAHIQRDNVVFHRYAAETCISFLVMAPTLQSTSGEPTRDKELTDLVLRSEASQLHLTAPIFFDHIGRRLLKLSLSSLDEFFLKLGTLLRKYIYSRSEKLQMLVCHVLDSTSHVWLQEPARSGEVGSKARALCHWLSNLLMENKILSWQLRDRLACFFDRYLGEDPTQKTWSLDGSPNEGSFPAVLLPMLGADPDIRVRFRAAVFNAHLFSIAKEIDKETLILYNDIRKSLTIDLQDYEHMLTRILSLGNMMVVSSAVRRAPYWHLLEICLKEAAYARHIESVLLAVSDRLGLASFAVLFEIYASQLAYSIRQAKQDFLLIPPHLLGSKDRKECAEAVLRAFTPTNVIAGGPDEEAIAHGEILFQHHCEAIQKTTEEGIRECFGDMIGFQIATWMDNHVNSDATMGDLDEQLRKLTRFMKNPTDLDELLRQYADGIAAAIFRTLGDQDFSKDGAIAETLRRVDSGNAAQIFQGLNRYRDPDEFEIHPPNLPRFDTEIILRALFWLYERVPEAKTGATSYHVLHELFADVRGSPLVNEQIRLVNAIVLWVACHGDHFEDPTLVFILIRGATSLLPQSDLARAAQSLLDWGFRLHRKIGQKDTRIPEILIRICCIAQDYAQDAAFTAISVMGEDLLQWVDRQTISLSSNPSLKSEVVKALPAWPHTLSSELAQLHEDQTSDAPSTVLGNDRISSNKFCLVKRLHDLAIEKKYDEQAFAHTDFWRLKDCIPPADQLRSEDAFAFASLLVLNKGRIHSFPSGYSSSQSIRTRHLQFHRKKPLTSMESTSSQNVILVSLLSMLDGKVTAHIDVAYRTLRFLLSVSRSEIPKLQSWPAEYRQELEYLQVYPRLPGARQLLDLSELSAAKTRPSAASAFPEWIRTITTLLCDILARADPFYAHLAPILRTDVGFADEVLPILVHRVLQVEADQAGQEIPCRTVLSNYFTSVLTSGTFSTPCLRSIIDTVLHLRNFPYPKLSGPLSHDKWLDLDFTLLAQNAISCGAYTTSLLFLELASEYASPSVAGDTTEKILFSIYSNIDEPDGFYGIDTKDLGQFLINRFHHEKQWEKAFHFHGAEMEAGNVDPVVTEGLLHSFHSFGFNNLAIDTLRQGLSSAPNSTSTSSMSFRLGWRTETWDLPDQYDQYNADASLYRSLRAVHRERDVQAIHDILRRAFLDEMNHLRAAGTENLVQIRQLLQNLMCLSQVAQWMDASIQSQLQSKQIDAHAWPVFTDIDPDFDFPDLESILATRISLIHSIRQKEERQQIGTLLTPFARTLKEVEKKCLLRLSEAARVANHKQIALNSVVRTQKLDTSPSFEVSQEFSSVLWLHHEEKLAIQHLKQLVFRDPPDYPSQKRTSVSEKAVLLSRLGTWTSEACLEQPDEIWSRFFKQAISLIASTDPESFGGPARAAVIYHQCAIFAEHQYHAILKSPDAIRFKVYTDRKSQDIKWLQEQIFRAPAQERKILEEKQIKAKVLMSEDQVLFHRHQTSRDAFLAQAIDMYSHCLEISDDFDDDGIVRLCSLWFSNFDNTGLQDKVRVAIARIPSRKFVFLVHQLAARLSKPPSAKTPTNQDNLHRLVTRMCEEHPFHSLYPVYCLLPDPAASSTATTRRQSSRHDISSSQSERGAAVIDIFDRLRSDATRGKRVRDLEYVCDAYLELAKYPVKEKAESEKKRVFDVPSDLKIVKVKKMQVPVVTAHTPLDPSLRYDDCAWIEKYDSRFDLAGGINWPKIIICHGSDGARYKQLFKGEGKDDLRQDAVMEQVFSLVNIVLRRDRETRRRDLKVRGYKVIPLDSQAGVLEFVGNTCPLSSWLPGAHKKYRPNDMTPEVVSRQLRVKRDESKKLPEGARAGALLAVFLHIRENFKPVMRHWFTESHKVPVSWFTTRLNYTRSVATTSIVGHILGLGDRHTSNILVDKVTGEVVHIDLGIAFDQGKYLPVPERVPFRMTADMVDGMGISGTQGVFQRCAEETLRVLRDGSEVVMTVLEVFKHDPLHSWTASELKIKRAQGTPPETIVNDTAAMLGIGIDMTSGTAEELAHRALNSVARKLNKALSVEYTVNKLIAEATDPGNLSSTYHGWTPQY